MNTVILEGKWNQLKGEVKKQWGKLTNDDLDRIQGQRDKLEGRLQERYGYSRQQARDEVDKFLAKADSEMNSLLGAVESKVHETQSRLQERVNSAKDSVESKAEDYNRQVREAAPGEVSYAVEEYPWLVIVGALVAGLLIGLMLSPGKK